MLVNQLLIKKSDIFGHVEDAVTRSSGKLGVLAQFGTTFVQDNNRGRNFLYLHKGGKVYLSLSRFQITEYLGPCNTV